MSGEKTKPAAAATNGEGNHDVDDGNVELYFPRVIPEKVSVMMLLIIAYGAAWFLGGSVVAPGGGVIIETGAVWSVVLIWLGAQVGGTVADMVKLPPLLGMLLSGMLLRNLPGNLVEDLPKEWSGAIRSAGLSVILMRSGLELDLEAFKKVGWMAVRLTAMPGASEAIVAGAFATLIFGMSITLGLSLGFILGAVSPAVVVLGMFDLQSRGYGVAKGIPSLVVAAASFDDVVAISGYTIFKSFALSAGHGGLAWTIMHGPVDMITGVTAGAMAGVVASCTAFWDTRVKRSAIIFLLGMLLMFAGKYIDFSGGGAMGGLCMGIVANKLWASGWAPGGNKIGRLSLGPDSHFAHEVENDLAAAWKSLFQPLLFGVIGSAIKFATLSPATIPRSILLIFIGLCVRLPAAFVATSFGALNFKEKLFIALSWMPKATVQAALASDPLETILSYKTKEANFEEWEQWGNDILTTSVFSIILTAPLGMLIINFLGPRWLTKDVDPDAEMHDAMAVVNYEESVSFRKRANGSPNPSMLLADGSRGVAAGAEGESASMDEGMPTAEDLLRDARDHLIDKSPGQLPLSTRRSSLLGDGFENDTPPSRRRRSLDDPRLAKQRKSFDGLPPTHPRTAGHSPEVGVGMQKRMPRHSVGSLDGGELGNIARQQRVPRQSRVPSGRGRTSSLFSTSGRNSLNTIDESDRLEILTSSLRLHIEEQDTSEKTTRMLGTLTAINDLCRKHMSANKRPTITELDFENPGNFFRLAREGQYVTQAATNLLEGAQFAGDDNANAV